ncbi:ATP-dependent endonuclease [Okeania sp. SIO2B3]|uniref:ATP-dependent nuclease n=1 Tax=Okeania sp. SIO2B3 TaxID=2607784 RepID=UPI0013C214A9|nr:AAA family ATPase [Okeania sp. SIO2B3]NET46048.1 AAA family ATPase [Okeania sp. SIO2B3]
MRLHSVKIKRLRSIEEVELKDCGDFNVLIGKNNAGKSSILLAIDTFFECIKDGNIITFNPTLKKEIDFFNKETDSSIEIVVTFGLDSNDKKDLMKVINEATQMKNPVDKIKSAKQLLITLNITPPPITYSLVTQIKLIGSYIDDDGTVILTIDDSTAQELYAESLQYRNKIKYAEEVYRVISEINVNSILREYWKLSGSTSEVLFFRYFFAPTKFAETKIPQELGIRLSSLFMFDRLVFVEGKSDEDVIREWASKLGVNFSQANVGFVIMGGVRNFAHFATETTLSFLTKRQVKMWFLLDRDEKEDSEVSKLQSRLGNNAKLKVLSKREIENYLICPSTIRRFIQSKKELEGKPIDELPEIPEIDEISNKIEECAEKLKQLSIDKRIIKKLPKLIYPSEKNLLKDPDTNTIVERINLEINSNIKQLEESKKDTENIYKEILSEVEKNWNYKKLDIVPGDLLLDQVCQIYNVRFNKTKDASRMAALMDKNKIDSEICEIIKEIGSSN